jgi:threonine dehydratase
MKTELMNYDLENTELIQHDETTVLVEDSVVVNPVTEYPHDMEIISEDAGTAEVVELPSMENDPTMLEDVE